MPKTVRIIAWLLLAGAFLPRLVSFAADARRTFNVKEFGAAGDGKTFDTKAIQSAIDAASHAGGGVVILAAGTFLSGSVWMKSHVELRIEAGATLLGSASRPDYQQSDRWYALLLGGRSGGRGDFRLRHD